MAKKNRKSTSRGISLIKKSNQLIEARYKFDIWETRIFLTILAQIRREDTEFDQYRIWYKDVAREFGLKSNSSYELLRQAAQGLMQKSFFVNYEADGVAREMQYHILRKIDYMAEGEEAKQVVSQEFIDVTVEPEMKPLLLELQKNFTSYEIRHVKKLGAYPIRIYELLKQFESIGHRTMQVEEIKRKLELTTEYPRFSNFFQKIIVTAVDAINKHSDIEVHEIVQIKAGRSVVALKFYIRAKPELLTPKPKHDAPRASKNVPTAPISLFEQPALTNDAAEQDRLFLAFEQVVVRQFGVSPTVFLEQLKGSTEAQLAQAVRVTQAALAENRVKNASGFFVEALRKGFTNPTEEKKKRLARREAMQVEIENTRREIGQWQDQANAHVNEVIRKLVAAEPDLAAEAVTSFQQNQVTKTYLENRERLLGRPLTLEDYRHDPTLRDWVRLKIMELRRPAFEPALSEMEQSILKLRDQLERLSREANG